MPSKHRQWRKILIKSDQGEKLTIDLLKYYGNSCSNILEARAAKKCDLLDRREARLELEANCKTRLWRCLAGARLEKVHVAMWRMVIVKITVHRLRDKLVSHGKSA